MRINRRGFMAAVSAGALLGMSEAARAGIHFHGKIAGAAPFNPPVVGPATIAGGSTGNWTGPELGGVGGVAPTNPAPGANGQPAGKWKQANELRFFQDLIVGVHADGCSSSIDHVTIYGDCNPVTITQRTLRTETDLRGHTKNRLGYWAKLNYSAFAAISTASTSAIRLFADIVAKDGSMTTRTIGNNVVDATGAVGDVEMRFYPRVGEFSQTFTVGATTGTYPTLTAARQAARTANTETPCILIVDNGTYDLASTTGAGSSSNAKGRMTIMPAPGVTATLGMSTPFDPNNAASWEWNLGWPSVELRNNGLSGGSGLNIDMFNWCRTNSESSGSAANAAGRFKGGALLNGVRFWNSVVNDASKDWMAYWNGGPKPGNVNFRNYSYPFFNASNATSYDHWYDCVTEHFTTFPWLGTAYVVSGCKDKESVAIPFQGNTYTENTYLYQTSVLPVRGSSLLNANRGVSALTIQGPAGSTVRFLGGASQNLGNGSISGTTLTLTGSKTLRTYDIIESGGAPGLVLPGTYVTAGGTGTTFTVSQSQTVAAGTFLVTAAQSTGNINGTYSGGVLLMVSGVPVPGWPKTLGRQSGQGGCFNADLAALINAEAGWSCTDNGCKVLGARWISLLDNGTTSPPTALDVDTSVSSPKQFNAISAIHSDWRIGPQSGTTHVDNIIDQNNITQDGYWNSSILFNVQQLSFAHRNGLHSVQGAGARGLGAALGTGNGIAGSQTNVGLSHTWFDGALNAFLLFPAGGPTVAVNYHSNFAQTIVLNDSTALDAAFSTGGNLFGTFNSKSIPTGSPVNVQLQAGTVPASYALAYVNPGAGASADFTVSETGPLVSHLVAFSADDQFDVFYNPRGKDGSGLDVVGPVARNYTAPAPFNFATG